MAATRFSMQGQFGITQLIRVAQGTRRLTMAGRHRAQNLIFSKESMPPSDYARIYGPCYKGKLNHVKVPLSFTENLEWIYAVHEGNRCQSLRWTCARVSCRSGRSWRPLL